MLEIFNGQLEKAANRYDASLVCECILAGCSYLLLAYPPSVCTKAGGVFVSQYPIAKFETQAQESCVPSLKVISRNIWKHSATILSLVRRGALFFEGCLR